MVGKTGINPRYYGMTDDSGKSAYEGMNKLFDAAFVDEEMLECGLKNAATRGVE